MINRYNLKRLSKKLSYDRYDFMSAFRKNVNMYLKESDFTIKSLSEAAEIPIETLKSFLHMGTRDCKVSTAVKLARALGISVDELIGAETLEFDFKHNCAICRNLPDNSMYLINWIIREQEKIYRNVEKGSRVISVVKPWVDNNGNMKPIYTFTNLDISNISNDIKYKTFLGLQIPDDRYMPAYTPYDILLIANDRKPKPNEDCLIICGGNMFIARKKSEFGRERFYSIRDGRFRANDDEIDEFTGYIAGLIRE